MVFAKWHSITYFLNIYIDGVSDILNKSSIGGPIGGKRINHMLYADDLCIVSLSKPLVIIHKIVLLYHGIFFYEME